VKTRAPRYYDVLFERKFPATMVCIREMRQERARLKAADNTKPRLADREKCLKAKVFQLKRGYENG